MKVSVSGIDALQSYRLGLCDGASSEIRHSLPDGFVPKASLDEVLRIHDRYRTGIPLHCAVTCDKDRRNSTKVRCSVISRHVPKESFIPIGRSSYIASPELCVLELASNVTVLELVVYISELCSGYSLLENSKRGYRNRLPLSDLDAMKEFIDACAGAKHRRIASKACRFALQDSNSPMETLLALLLSLPRNIGGYGLQAPKLNAAVCGFEQEPPKSFVRTGNPIKGVRYGDLVYQDCKLVVEYLSKTFHRNRWDEDALRTNELLDAGFKVISVTPAQVFDAEGMNEVAAKVARQRGKELPDATPGWCSLNLSLRSQLFGLMNIDTNWQD